MQLMNNSLCFHVALQHNKHDYQGSDMQASSPGECSPLLVSDKSMNISVLAIYLYAFYYFLGPE